MLLLIVHKCEDVSGRVLPVARGPSSLLVGLRETKVGIYLHT